MRKTYLNKKDIELALANIPQITFEVTDACNLKCKYCAYGEFYNDYDKRDNKKLSIGKAYRLIDFIIPYWKSNLNLSSNKSVFISFYGGEPLLNMTFVKTIIEYLEHKTQGLNIVFNYSMTTNAILLYKYIDYLQAKNFHLLISLDGDKENTSYRINKKGHNAFGIIKENVDLIKNKYPTYFENRVQFNAVLHNRNSVDEIYNFFKSEYNKIPTIGEINNVGIREDKQKIFNETYRNSLESLQQSENYDKIEEDMFLSSTSYKAVTLFLHQYSGFVFRDYNELLFGKKNKQIPTGTCIPFGKKMFVTVNGKLLPCERIGHQFALGEVTDEEVIIDFDAITTRYNNYYKRLDEKCTRCRIKESCIQCIFNLENINSDKPICHGFVDDSRFNQYVKSQMFFLQKHPESYKKIMEEITVVG